MFRSVILTLLLAADLARAADGTRRKLFSARVGKNNEDVDASVPRRALKKKSGGSYRGYSGSYKKYKSYKSYKYKYKYKGGVDWDDDDDDDHYRYTSDYNTPAYCSTGVGTTCSLLLTTTTPTANSNSNSNSNSSTTRKVVTTTTPAAIVGATATTRPTVNPNVFDRVRCDAGERRCFTVIERNLQTGCIKER